MGCWNKTCGVTNLPIFWNQEVVWFLLVQNPRGDVRSCYSNGHWEMIPLPIYGKYDDSGWIEPHPGQEWKLELFKQHFADRLVKLNDEVKEDSPFISFEVLNESFRENSFAMRDYKYERKTGNRINVDCKFADFFVHRDTFDELTANQQGPWSDDVYTRQEIEENIKLYNAWFDAKIAATTDEDKLWQLKYIRSEGNLYGEELTEFVKTLPRQPKYEHNFAGSGYLRYWSGKCGSESGYITNRFVYSCVDHVPFKERMDAYLFHTVMDGLRKSYYPQGHEGSQDDMWGLHDQFAKTYLKRIEDRQTLYHEELYNEDEAESEEE